MPGTRSQAQPIVKEYLLSGGAFRSASAIQYALSQGMAKRTTDNLLKSLCQSGDLTIAKRGIFIPTAILSNRPAALYSIAHAYQDSCIASLDSAFDFANVTTHCESFMVVSKGKIGTLAIDGVGSIRILNASQRMQDSIERKVGVDKTMATSIPNMHTKEMAFTLACYLSEVCNEKSKYNMGNIIDSGEDLDFELVRAMGEAALLPPRVINSAIERHDACSISPSV